MAVRVRYFLGLVYLTVLVKISQAGTTGQISTPDNKLTNTVTSPAKAATKTPVTSPAAQTASTAKTNLEGVKCPDEKRLCSKNAECGFKFGFVPPWNCACKAGYDGDGFTCTMKEINECEERTDNCDNNAHCIDLPLGFTCICRSGFNDTSPEGQQGTYCTDYDECAHNNTQCMGEGAKCVNTPGSYRCQCPEGMKGDGVGIHSCNDGPICPDKTTICSKDAICGYTWGGKPEWNCTCKAGYLGNGHMCTDINECALQTDDCNNEAVCQNTDGGFTCKCKDGFSDQNNDGRVGLLCEDIDECLIGNDDCDNNANCDNTIGGYTCTCRDGYKDTSGKGRNGTKCEDLNECKLNTHDCDINASCENTIGGYTCTCRDGYNGLNVSGRNGTECTDKNECTEGSDLCDDNADCTNTPGSYTCTCRQGYNDTSSNGTQCQDINECTLQTHDCDDNADCMNSIGGYTCACRDGYNDTGGNGTACKGTPYQNSTQINKLTDTPTAPAKIAIKPLVATPADQTASTARTSQRVTTGQKSTLNNKLTNTVTSPAKAATKPPVTSPAAQTASTTKTNLEGEKCPDEKRRCSKNAICGYEFGIAPPWSCTCKPGYEGDGFNCTIKKINECAERTDNCDNNADCIDLPSGFTCTCRSGFNETSHKGHPGTNCTDYDECTHNKSLCMGEGALCVNTPGSYKCQCPEGMKGDGVGIHSCNDGPICPDKTTICSKNAICGYTWGGKPEWNCTCKLGYVGDGYKCTDINECDIQTDDCDNRSLCQNTDGGFTCQCKDGFNDTSKSGRKGRACDDIDECITGIDDCDDNADCKNSIGGYTCTCRDGFNDTSGNGSKCEDIDECTLQTHDCDINAGCENSIGGYICSCNPGYNDTSVGSRNGTKCADLNECKLGTDDCDSKADCKDTIGGYTCTCNPGYNDTSVSGRNGTSCTDIDECKDNNYNCDDNASCTNIEGSFSCTCIPGFEGTGVICTTFSELTNFTTTTTSATTIMSHATISQILAPTEMSPSTTTTTSTPTTTIAKSPTTSTPLTTTITPSTTVTKPSTSTTKTLATTIWKTSMKPSDNMTTFPTKKTTEQTASTASKDSGPDTMNIKCPTSITAIASPRTGMAQVDLNLGGGTIHRLSLPIGSYNYDAFTEEGVNCSLSVQVTDPWLKRRLEFRADYNVSCGQLGNPITLSIVRSLVKDDYKTIHFICQQDCDTDLNREATLHCESHTLTVTWPTSQVYGGNITQIPIALQARLRQRMGQERQSALRLVISNRTPPIVYPSLTDNGGYVKLILTSFCGGNKMYIAERNACI